MIRRAALLLLMIVAPVPLIAHHGAGNFDLTKTITFNGAKLTRLEMINPHGWIYFETTEPDGKVMKHRCEMRSAHVLRRSGWSPELFPVGQKIDITASPDRFDAASCYLQTIVLPSGARMDRYGQYVKAPEGGLKEVRGAIKEVSTNRPARLPNGQPNLGGDWAPEQLVMADPRGTGGGLVPLSTINQSQPGRQGGGARRGGGPGAGPRLYGGTELTEAGEKAAAAFTRDDNPRFKCQTTSIIFDWTFDGPVNRITQNKDTILIQYGQMELKRTVHLDQAAHPAKITPTRAGHSIGKWEGDTLVVDTVGFLPGVLNAPVRNSDKMHVVERFTLEPKTMKLTRAYEVDDPVYLKGKYTGSDVIQPADAPYTGDTCKEQGFIDYSKQTQRR